MSTLRKYWLGIAALILLAVAVLLSVAFPQTIKDWESILEAIAVSAGWILFLVQYFYSKSEGFYVFINGWRLWLTNEPTKWNFTVSLHGCSLIYPMRSVWEVISQQNRKANRWHNDEQSLIVNMPGYTLRAFVSEGAFLLDDNLERSQTLISIQISNLELPYRTFRTKIENEMVPLLRDVANALQPRTEKYAAKISFSSTNPYFGFFVRKLELPKVVSFTCDLIESSVGGHEQVITIRKDQIEIVTDDLLAMQSLSLKYVALANN